VVLDGFWLCQRTAANPVDVSGQVLFSEYRRAILPKEGLMANGGMEKGSTKPKWLSTLPAVRITPRYPKSDLG
jgi:hypothetical protein